ncbi:Ger(x)C family spore germination protein [Bacillus sp. FJAT-49732]|uniref:Ger(X)C family spore germination protein n=1 Tax=Lederbergia citrisecunda TaxID=2833583 RepID=A0A942YM16_9BACI|nr:Ger(x)C family spore germination protein [Lederbergia citrisecunda]MBS4200210.1 Ger(x)C family spore germination protein [Lederbergia citrisecunda]
MKKSILILFLFSPLLSGCVQTSILDDLTLTNAGGIDYIDGNKIKITAIYSLYNAEKEAEDENITVTINHRAGILDHLSREAQWPVITSELDVFVIDMKTAERGIFPIIDTLQRDASIGSRVYLAISEGSANELLLGKYKPDGSAKYISSMIENNIKHRNIPNTNLHLFSSDFFQEAKGSYLPVLKKVSEDKVELDGLAIFHKDKLVYKLPVNDMFYFKILVDQHLRGTLVVQVDHKGATIENIKSSSSIKTDLNAMTVDIKYEMIGTITKYTGKKLNRSKTNKIAKKLEEKINSKIKKNLTDFQDMGIDPVGIERKFRQQHRDFNEKKWKENYKNVKFNVHSKVTITESGTLE